MELQASLKVRSKAGPEVVVALTRRVSKSRAGYDLGHVDDLDHAKLSAAVLLLPPPANAPTARTSWSALGPYDGNLGDWFTEGSTDFKPAWLNSAPTGREVVQGFPVSALLAYSYVHMSRYYCAHHDVYCLIRGLWADGRIDNMKDALALLLTIIDLHPAPSTVLYNTQSSPMTRRS